MGMIIKTFPAVTVAAAGTAQPLSSTPIFVSEVHVQSVAANTGTQYIGDSTVTSSNGTAFSPGDSAEIKSPPNPRGGHDQFDLNKVYVNSSTNGAAFRILAWVRE